MLISQDIVRREMLFVNDGPNTEASKLLLELALYGKNNCDIVILEGILDSKWYRSLFESLATARLLSALITAIDEPHLLIVFTIFRGG